nr:uncharacterized protein LOC109186512 [Ipomoea trifida]
MKMGGKLSILLLLAIFFTTSTASRDISELPHFNRSFTVKANQQPSVHTQWTSEQAVPQLNTPEIKSAFHLVMLMAMRMCKYMQVYVARLDDPDSDTFERCSRDTFKIKGPCMDDVCYLYLYRVGSDGWKPQTVTVYISAYRYVTFIYNRFIPRGVWYGFNHCDYASISTVA